MVVALLSLSHLISMWSNLSCGFKLEDSYLERDLHQRSVCLIYLDQLGFADDFCLSKHLNHQRSHHHSKHLGFTENLLFYSVICALPLYQLQLSSSDFQNFCCPHKSQVLPLLSYPYSRFIRTDMWNYHYQSEVAGHELLLFEWLTLGPSLVDSELMAHLWLSNLVQATLT